MRINKITLRCFYAPSSFPRQKFKTPPYAKYPQVYPTCCWETTKQGAWGGVEAGASSALMIKISWEAVVDPQYAAFVSSKLHKNSKVEVAKQQRKEIT